MSDLISRKAAYDTLTEYYHHKTEAQHSALREALTKMPSVHIEPSEITDEQAILHLQSTGWMQNHDREIYESGLRERLADDSGDYDSLISCANTISRRAAIDALQKEIDKGIPPFDDMMGSIRCGVRLARNIIEDLPSAQPEQTEMIKEIREWINSGNRGNADYFIVDKIEEIIDRYE